LLASGNVALFACNTNTEVCNSWDLGTPYPENVTEIYIGPRISDRSPVYVVTMTGDVINYLAGHIVHSSVTWSNMIGTTKDNLGVDPVCGIAPAAAECTSEGGTCSGVPTESCSDYHLDKASCNALPGCSYERIWTNIWLLQYYDSCEEVNGGPSCSLYEDPSSCAAAGCDTWTQSSTDGVFFASTWQPQQVVTTIVDNINIPFTWTDVEANSYGFLGTDSTWGDPVQFSNKGSALPYQATSNAKLALQTCSEDTCFQLSGITSHYTANVYDWTKSDLYYQENGGQWFQAAENPFLDRYLVGDPNTQSAQYQDCYISDNYVAWGAINGKLFAVRTKAIEANGLGVGTLATVATPAACRDLGGSGVNALQDRWQGLYVDMYNPVTDAWTNVYSDGNLYFDNDGTWPADGDENFAANIGKHMVCDSDRCLHFWIAEDGDQGVLQIYNYGTTITPTPDVRNFIPQGEVIGADMSNYVGAGRYINGFAEATDGSYEYYAFRSLNSGGSGFVARVPTAGGASQLASPIVPWSVTIQGLRADPLITDQVYYSLIPASIGANTTDNPWCGQMYNSTSPNYALKSDDGDIWPSIDGGLHRLSGYYADNKELRYVICDYEIWQAGGAGLQKIYSDQINKRGDQYMSGHFTQPIRMRDYGVLTAPGIGWSIGDFDEFGKYYTMYIEGLCQGSQGYCMSTTGSYYVRCCPDYIWRPGDPDAWPTSTELTVTYATFQEDEGVRFPLRQYYDDASRVGDGDYANPNQAVSPDGFPLTDNPTNNYNELRELVAVTGNRLELCGTQIRGREGQEGCLPFGSLTPAYDLGRPYGQKRWVGEEPNSLMTWDTFKGTTSRLTVGQTNLNVPVYIIQGETSESSQGFTEFGCYVSSLTGLRKVGGSVIDEVDCPAQMLSSDVDRDGTDEVIFAKGIYEYANAEQVVSLNRDASSSFGIVDVTSDSYLDLVFLTSTTVEHIISTADINVQYSGELKFDSVLCSANDGDGVITVTPIGISAKNPETLEYRAELENQDGSVKKSTTWKSTYPLTFKVSAGEYAVDLFIRDQLTGEEVAKTCQVNAVINPENLPVNQADLVGIGECSLGDDGEFNFVDSIENHNWLPAFIDGEGYEILGLPTMGGGYAYMDDRQTGMIHALDCSYDTLSAEIKLGVNEESVNGFIVHALSPTDSVFEFRDLLKGTTGTGIAEEGLSTIAAAVYIESEITSGPNACTSPPCLYADTIEGYKLIAENLLVEEDNIITLTVKSNENGDLNVDGLYGELIEQYTRDYGEIIISLNGENVGVFTSPMQFQGYFSAVSFHHIGGKGFSDVDYIRTAAIDEDGVLGEETDPRSEEDEEMEDKLREYALNCAVVDSNGNAVSRLGNNEQYLEIYSDVKANLKSLCSDPEFARDNNGKYCSFDELRKLIKFNNECYKVAHDYCIEETYPKSTGFGTEDENIELSQGSLSGAAACSSALALTTSASNVGRPFFALMWDQFTTNTASTLFWVFIFFLVIIAFARSVRR
jgi:hypothetical protein